MKKLFFVILLIISLSNLSCEQDFSENYQPIVTDYLNAELKDIYNSLPVIGFESGEYSISDYSGKRKTPLINFYSGKKLCVWQSSDSLYLKYDRSDNENCKDFIFEPTGSVSLVIIYCGDKPMCIENVPIYPPVELINGSIIHYSTALVISSVDLNENSFFIKGSPYDYWCEHSGFYMNGKIIIDYIVVEGTIPLSVSSMRIWDEKLILKLSTHAADELFAIFDPIKKEIIYPVDANEVKLNMAK